MKRRSLNGIIVFGYSIALGCLLYFLWITYQNLQKTSQESRDFTTALVLLDATEAVFSDIRDIETGARGFVITGEEDYLRPFYSGKQNINSDLALLKRTFRNGLMPAESQKLYSLVNERIKRSDKQVELRRTHGMQSAIQTIHAGKGILIMDSIRMVVARIQTVCHERLNKSNQDKKLMAKNTLRDFTIYGGLVIVFLIFSCFLVVRAFRKKYIYEKQVQNLSSLADNIHDAILFTDIGFVITDWNEGAGKMFGYKEEEAIGKSCMSVLGSNLIFEKRLLITNEILLHGFWKGEMLCRRKNNEAVMVQATATALESHGGELGGFIFLIGDITGVKVINDKLSAVLESTDQCIILVNEKGQIESSNAIAEEFFGYTKEEMHGQLCHEFFPAIRTLMIEQFSILYKNQNRFRILTISLDYRKKNTLMFPLEVELVFFKSIKGGFLIVRSPSFTDKVLADFKSLLNPQTNRH